MGLLRILIKRVVYRYFIFIRLFITKMSIMFTYLFRITFSSKSFKEIELTCLF